jgi:hypothetical protein
LAIGSRSGGSLSDSIRDSKPLSDWCGPVYSRLILLQDTYRIVMTFIPPLTTTFTPPASCFEPTKVESTLVWMAFGFDCLPSAGTTDLYTPGFFSPGVCPSGYTSACSFDSTSTLAASDNRTEITLASGEFGQKCCPR